MSSAANQSSRFAQFGVGLSVALHVGAFLVLTVLPKTPAPAPLPSVVEFELSKPPEPPPPAPKAAEPPPPPEPLAIEPASVRAEPTPAEAPPAPPATLPVVQVRDLDWPAIRTAVDPPAIRARMQQTVQRMEALLGAHRGLLLAGNSYRGVSINACIANAPTVADAALRAVGRGLSGQPGAMIA